MSTIPDELKKQDLSRFIDKAEELEKYQPIISYWCFYHVVQKIIQAGLHRKSPECEKYAGALMDRIEALKVSIGNREEITDESEAAKYVAELADAVLDRGNLQIHSNTVTQRTVHALRAAYTFFDLLEIWSAVTPEIASKTKYAKYHAVRILKAIQAGQDPNLTNPTPPVANTPQVQDAGDAEEEEEVQQEGTSRKKNLYKAKVEDDNDAELDRELEALAAAGVKDTAEASSSSAKTPTIPKPTGSIRTSRDPAGSASSSSPLTKPASSKVVRKPTAPAASAVSRPTTSKSKPTTSSRKARVEPDTTEDEIVEEEEVADFDSDRGSGFVDEDEPDPEVIAQAQKHSKWAVSALDFNDTPTAIKELTIALRLLEGL